MECSSCKVLKKKKKRSRQNLAGMQGKFGTKRLNHTSLKNQLD